MQSKAIQKSRKSKIDLTNTERLFKIESNTSIEKCIEGKPMLNQTRKGNDKELKINIDFIITANMKLLGIELTHDQIYAIVQNLVSEYSAESYEDIVLLFKKIRTGKYGKLYGRLDFPFIADCMKKHLEEKYLYREKLLTNAYKLKICG